MRSVASIMTGLSAFGILLMTTIVVVVNSAPDMFTAMIDMQRALSDEQSAATLLQQYVKAELRRLQQLQRYR